MRPGNKLGNLTLNINKTTGFFTAGNQYSKKENLTPEASKKRMTALFQSWGTKQKKAKGEIKGTRYMVKKKKKRERYMLKTTVAREAREIQEQGRRSAEQVMARLAEIAINSPNETAAIAAGVVVLDRSYGKANQTNITASIDANGAAKDISQEELNTRIEQTLKRVEALTGGATKAPKSQKPAIDLRKLDRDPNGSPLN
jgi:hypothetical protein